MAAKYTKTKEETKKDTGGSEADRIASYEKEFNNWLQVLQKYHTVRFDRNYRQYTAYTQTQATHTKISDPLAPELVERVVQKMFERDPKFLVMARGKNLPPEITKLMEAVCEYLWTDPEVVQATGTMRSKLKQLGREFLVLGNGVTETYYNGEADAPDWRVWPLEDVIFNPTTTLKKSKRRYLRQYVDIEYLESQMEVTEDGEVKAGLFKHIPELKASLNEDKAAVNKNDPTPNWVNRYGTNQMDRPVDKILLISVWDGDQLCQIANWDFIVREVDDPLGLEDDPLDEVMDIEVPKIPYAFSLLDFLNGLTQAKDLLLNQVVDYGTKALNPPLFVDPSVASNPVNKASLRNAYRAGGLVFANPQSVTHLPMPALPTVGFELLGYLQQRAESTSGIGAYLSGVPNQANDKTKGTKGGIQALIEQSISPVHDRQQNIEESIIEPIINKMLRLVGELMGTDEEKWIFVSGQQGRWVKVTRGILTGKISVEDLVSIGLLDKEDAPEVAAEHARKQKEIGKGEDEPLFDVDWIVRVETGSMAEVDTQKDLENFDSTMSAAIATGVPIDAVKVWKERAMRAGIKEPEQYLIQQNGQGGEQGQPATPPNQASQKAPGPDPAVQTAKLAAEADKTKAETQKIQVETQMLTQPETQTRKAPFETIAYKDAPPDIQRQMESQAGLHPSQLHPAVAAMMTQPMTPTQPPQEQQPQP